MHPLRGRHHRAAEPRADLFFLASDRMQGRLTNTPTNELAADWVLSPCAAAWV